MKPLNILISNDDGVFAAGIRALAKSAQKRGHKVKVVCPDQERSATGHGLTLQSPLRVEKADELFGEGIEAWGCSGTPADCVKLALSELLDHKPDLVLSGINHGPNLGTDIFCSGTVAAAMEGTLENVPSMAISVASFKWKNFEFAGEIAMNIVEQAIKDSWPASLLLNLNIPPCEKNKIKEFFEIQHNVISVKARVVWQQTLGPKTEGSRSILHPLDRTHLDFSPDILMT